MRSNCTILADNLEGLTVAASLLRTGKLVSVPTETVYGLAANALAEDAVRQIFEVKGRPYIDPLIVHFSSLEQAAEHIHSCEGLSEIGRHFWPGPLTVVVRKRNTIPDLVTAGLDSVAVRISAHPSMIQLLGLIDFPLAAPSANPFGYLSPTRAEHVVRTLGERISAVLDGGACAHGIESTILDLREPREPKILRPGPVTAEALEAVLGTRVGQQRSSSNPAQSQAAPGMLDQHYSPRGAVILEPFGSAKRLITDHWSEATPLVVFSRPPAAYRSAGVFWLSEQDNDLASAGAALFDLLHRLDQRGAKAITVECAPNEGIGKAINDRLNRAAAK